MSVFAWECGYNRQTCSWKHGEAWAGVGAVPSHLVPPRQENLYPLSKTAQVELSLSCTFAIW